MPRSKRAKPNAQGVLLRPSKESDRILELLHLQAKQFNQELTADRLELWLRDLAKYPLEAIEWAFENWRLHGRFFPVPEDIILQCDAWQPSTIPEYEHGCSADCKARHGKGFGKIEILALLELVRRRYNKMTHIEGTQRNDHSKYVPLTDDEILEMCRKVEARRA